MRFIYIYLAFIRFYWKATTIYHIHSPSVYAFLEQTWLIKSDDIQLRKIEDQRKTLQQNTKEITIQDHGAGSRSKPIKKRKISAIAKTALSKKKQCNHLFQIVKFINANQILEFGTSLGISTAYLAAANHKAEITTIDGDPNIQSIATTMFEHLSLNNIQSICSTFDNILNEPIIQETKWDIIYLDGNHTYEATTRYFRSLAKTIKEKAIIIVDDIYWSKEMTRAWNEIKNENEFSISIDFFYYGVLLFIPEQQENKIDLSIIEYKYKPWKAGFFQ